MAIVWHHTFCALFAHFHQKSVFDEQGDIAYNNSSVFFIRCVLLFCCLWLTGCHMPLTSLQLRISFDHDVHRDSPLVPCLGVCVFVSSYSEYQEVLTSLVCLAKLWSPDSPWDQLLHSRADIKKQHDGGRKSKTVVGVTLVVHVWSRMSEWERKWAHGNGEAMRDFKRLGYG